MKTKSWLMLASLATVAFGALSLKSPEPKVEPDPTSLKRGEKLVMTYCAVCHGGDDGKLSGKYMSDIPEGFGKVYTANITNHMDNGIGKYTREELRTLLRTRVKRNGEKAFMVMPGFPLMADADVEAIIDFLKSDNFAVQASSVKQPPQEMGFIFKMANKKMETFPMPTKAIPMPDPNNKMELGSYYVNAVFRCYECHSPEMMPNDLNPTSSKKYLSGGKTMYDLDKKKVKVANITPDKETGIGNWTFDDFKNVMTKGLRKNGKPVSFPMIPFLTLTDEEISAMYTYIMAQKPIHHKVKGS